MTKKAKNIFETYEMKLKLEIDIYNLGVTDTDKTLKHLHEIEEQFGELITGMYFYKLLSEKDFSELHSLKFPTYMKYWDMI